MMPTLHCPKTGRFALQAGMYISSKGYWRYSSGEFRNKYVHRHLMEQHLGRKLRKDEVVHHINGVKLDIRLENLVVMNERDHNAVSAKQFWYLKNNVWSREEATWKAYFGEYSTYPGSDV